MNEKELAENYDGLKSIQPKALLFDIETFSLVKEAWTPYDENPLRTLRNYVIACASWKWLGEKKIYSSKRTLQAKGKFEVKQFDDRPVTEQLWDLFNEADYIIAHNGKNFDVRKVNTRFLVHGFSPPSPYKIIDTKIIAKRVAGFDSNKLDDLARQLGFGSKEHTGGYPLWVGCMNNDSKAWAKMESYNRQDVLLLEQIYLRLRGWDTLHPNHNLYTRSNTSCRVCGSHNLHKRGRARVRGGWKQRYVCKECGATTHGVIMKTEGDRVDMI